MMISYLILSLLSHHYSTSGSYFLFLTLPLPQLDSSHLLLHQVIKSFQILSVFHVQMLKLFKSPWCFRCLNVWNFEPFFTLTAISWMYPILLKCLIVYLLISAIYFSPSNPFVQETWLFLDFSSWKGLSSSSFFFFFFCFFCNLGGHHGTETHFSRKHGSS